MRKNLTSSLAVTLVILVCVSVSSTQQQRQSVPDDLALEFAQRNGEPTYTEIPSSGGAVTINYYGFNKIAGWQQPSTPIGEPSGVQLVCKMEGDAVRVELSVFLGPFDRLDTPRSQKGVPEKALAVYFAKLGEVVSLSDLSRVGIEPFEVKVVKAKPPVPTPAQVINKTNAIEVVSVEEVSRQRYHLSLKNLSAKNIIVLNLYVPSQGGQSGQTSQGTKAHPAIKAGGVYETDVHISRGGRTTPQGYIPNPFEQPKIVIGTAVFDDGTFEGETEVASGIAAEQKGRKLQRARVVTLIQSFLDAPDQDTSVVIQKLIIQTSALDEEVDPAVVTELMTQYPSLSQQSKELFVSEVKTGLHVGKQRFLSEIKEFERARDSANGNLDYRNWLTQLKTRYEESITQP